MPRASSILHQSILVLALVLPRPDAVAAAASDSGQERIYFRSQGLPSPTDMTVAAQARRAVLKAFLDQRPNYTIEPFVMPAVQGAGMDSGPLMAIAAGVPPHCIYVNFRQSSTYIEQAFLAPLEVLLARHLSGDPRVRQTDDRGAWLADPSAAEVAAALQRIRERVPGPAWEVVYRPNTGSDDPEPHVWSLPLGVFVMGLLYRKDLFHEAGLNPDRPPRNWDELLACARAITDPAKRRYGMHMYGGQYVSWGCYAFIVSTDARAVRLDETDNWRAAYGTRGMAEAIYQIWVMTKQSFERDGETITQAAKLVTGSEFSLAWNRGEVGMRFAYLDDEMLGDINPQLVGVAPVPYSPMGTRGSEINCRMLGVFAESSPKIQLAVMDFIWNYTSEAAQRIRTKVYVENGMGRFVSPDLLEKFGYDRLLRQVPKGWKDAFTAALADGVPEPYGRNTQNIYRFMSEPMNKALEMDWNGVSRDQAVDQIEKMCVASAETVNVKVLGNIPPDEMSKRRLVAGVVLVLIAAIFAWMISNIWRYFSTVGSEFHRDRHWRRYAWGYVLLAPGIILVLWWQYIPLAGGLPISFMDFRLVRESLWLGVDNFAMVLWDGKFWGGLGRTIYFVALMIGLGFWPPILLAILLQEVPTDTLKYFFRTVYYLPAIISGVVVVFLWKQLYDPSANGVLNQLLLSVNTLGPGAATLLRWLIAAVWLALLGLLISVPWRLTELPRWLRAVLWLAAAVFVGVTCHLAGQVHFVGRFELAPLRWLESPELAMLCIVIPSVWAGSGPGCILYLAALKTVPDDLYEAADMDGAGNLHKVCYIVLPMLKYLIGIQFIAAVIGAFKGGTEYVLVMTGGGPNDATMLLSLEIFIRTFLDLEYGVGTAMAWILGTILIAFTAYQLRMLSRAEFRAADSTS